MVERWRIFLSLDLDVSSLKRFGWPRLIVIILSLPENAEYYLKQNKANFIHHFSINYELFNMKF
jgi:hypothetical protein